MLLFLFISLLENEFFFKAQATNEQIEECFHLFDKKKQGFLDKEIVGTVIRALGFLSNIGKFY